uniref:Secreted protein n=1 Tax=Lotharella oceanica TaxID=641309 RepID=A0A7S2XC64_9EUKA
MRACIFFVFSCFFASSLYVPSFDSSILRSVGLSVSLGLGRLASLALFESFPSNRSKMWRWVPPWPFCQPFVLSLFPVGEQDSAENESLHLLRVLLLLRFFFVRSFVRFFDSSLGWSLG